MAFIITVIIVGLLTMSIASDHMHPILAGLLAFPVATLTGGIVWALVRIWPVLRVIWWWAPEITTGMGAAYGWVALADATTAPITLAVLAPLVGIPAAVPAIRRRVTAIGMCFVVRHRLRVCFSQFIIANKSGSLPLILWARPTPVGERVWVYLRPGLSLARIQSRLDEIAVACHATSVLVELASASKKAAYLRFDIKRRDVLTAKVNHPMADGITTADIPAQTTASATVPTALDLPDVPADSLATAASSATATNGRKPAAKPAPAVMPVDDDPWD